METRLARVRALGAGAAACMLAALLASFARADDQTSEPAKTRFSQLDADQDMRLSQTEFMKAFAGPRVKDGLRQFKTFDRDADGALSLVEFRNVPGLLADQDRGPLADPLVDWATDAFEACEKQWAAWDGNGDGALDAEEFDAAEVAHLVPGLDQTRFSDWDRDSDEKLTLDECRLALEIAFGVRRPQGDLLRLADGRAVSWLGFKHVDRNGDDSLSLAECKQFGFDGEQTEARFQQIDADHDGKIGFVEWAAAPSRSIGASWQFLQLDANFDARLDQQELLHNPLQWQFPLTRYVLPAFDDDRDGKLDFYEFLATPLVCLQHKWHVAQLDGNHDGRLDFDEFRNPRDLNDPLDAAALTAAYFRRFDRDQDGLLDFLEFFFDSDAVIPDLRLKAWDADGDGRLSESEFVAAAGMSEAEAKRDFALFDLDGNGRMDASELGAVPKFAVDGRAARLPDPLQILVDRCVALTEKNRDRWDADRDGALNSGEFLDGLSQAIEVSLRLGAGQIDLDENGVVSFAEARRAAEMLAGLRGPDGEALREPNGRVCDVLKFRQLDRDRNAMLDPAEFKSGMSFLPDVTRRFLTADLDHDGQLSLKEWRLAPKTGLVDPVSEFRHFDANFDGRVDRDELLARVPDWKRTAAEFVFPGFDLNQDGALSLGEYRFTPLANPLVNWYALRIDGNGDERLSFAEFLGDEDAFPLLAWQYFQCLDVNSSGALETDEYFFKIHRPNALYSLNADGTGWRKLFQLQDYAAIGSPAVSPDGKTIAFDARKADAGRRTNDLQKLFCVDIDGTSPRELCHGLMPSWSPDGRSLACSRYSPSNGSWIVTADGRDERFLDSAWGGQWSPDGKQIVFYQGADVCLYDVAKHRILKLFAGVENPYNNVFWNMAWSPDGKRICFKGMRPDGSEEMGILTANGSQPKYRVRFRGKNFRNDFAWHPSQDRIMFGMHDAERGRVQLFELNPDDDRPPKWFPGQDPNRTNSAACWTPDGQRLIVVSGDF